MLTLTALTVACCSAIAALSMQDAPATKPTNPPSPPPLRVMSFNIRLDTFTDLEDRWEKRKAFAAETIKKFDPDLLGTQEVLANQGDYLKEQLTGYGFVGVGREDGERKGEFSAIFYRTARFDLIDSGTLWLSQKPDVVNSMGWDAACTRVMTWAKLSDKTDGKRLFVVNTHWDHVGKVARMESAKLMKKTIATIGAGLPTIITGDFNCTEVDPPYAELVDGVAWRDAYRDAHQTPADDEASFNGFKGTTQGKRIDWILCSPHWTVGEAGIDRTVREDGRYPSDHFPVTAVLTR